MGRVREEKKKVRRSEKKEDAGARKGRKVAIHCVFPTICGSGRSKNRLAKERRVRSHLARWEMKNCTPLWREARFEVKMYKTHHSPLLEVEMSKKCTPLWRKAHFQAKSVKKWRVGTTFGRWDVEKGYAVVARSTFPSQNVQKATCTDHFWRLRCGFAWQAQGIVHLVKSEQDVRVLYP